MNIKEQIVELIKEDKIDDALDIAFNYFSGIKDQEKKDAIALFKQRLSHITNLNGKGTETLDSLIIHRNRIVSDFYNFMIQYTKNDSNSYRILESDSITVEIKFDIPFEDFRMQDLTQIMESLNSVIGDNPIKYVTVRKGSVILVIKTNTQGAEAIYKTKQKSKYKILSISNRYSKNRVNEGWSDSNLVLLVGNNGVGKTSFLVSIFKYIYQNWHLTIDSHNSRSSTSRIGNLLTRLEVNNEFPPITSSSEAIELDLSISDGKHGNRHFTFMDIAGEEFNMFFDKGEFLPLKEVYKEQKVIIILFVDYENGKIFDRKLAQFLDYINYEEINPINIALIITKWDKSKNPNLSISEYLQTHMRHTYHMLDNNISNINRVMEFSVGTVINNKISDGIDLKYSSKILDWLYYEAGLLNENRSIIEKIIKKARKLFFIGNEKPKEID